MLEKDQEGLTPGFSNSYIPVVFAADNKYAPYLAVAIQSLIECSSTENNYDIIILETDISLMNKDILFSMVGCRPNIKIRFYNVGHLIVGLNLHIDRYVSTATYFRIFILKIMKRYKRVLYLDCDIIILQDLADLYHIGIGDNYLGATYNFSVTWHFGATTEQDSSYLGINIQKYFAEKLALKDPANYFQAGVLILNIEKMNADDMYTRFFQKLNEIKTPLFYDQDILNAICQDAVTMIPQQWDVEYCLDDAKMEKYLSRVKNYYTIIKEAQRNPKIIHYDGPGKPWMTVTPHKASGIIWWEFARRSPFYEQIVHKGIAIPAIHSVKPTRYAIPQEYRQVLFDLAARRTIFWWHKLYMVMAKITFGAQRNKYVNLRRRYANRLKAIASFTNELMK